MKIAQVCARYHPYMGGVETHVKDISEKLAIKGYEIEVLTTDTSGKLPKKQNINGIMVRRFKSWAPSNIIYFSKELHEYLMNHINDYDIIHAHDYQSFPMLSSAICSKHNKAHLLVTLHIGYSKIGKWIYSFYNPLFGKYIFDQASKILVVSPATLFSIPILSNYMDKISYIPNGVDVVKLDAYLNEYKTSPNDEKLRIISVGRIEKKKGLSKLIEALKHINNNKFSLRIVGRGTYKNELQKLILDGGYKLDIRFLGYLSIEELYKNYAKSDIFILLSEYESHSIALTEAMAFGLVPIVSNVGGNPYIINDNYNGFLLKYPINLTYLIGLLNEFHKNRSLIPNIKQNAIQTVKNNFNIDNIIEMIEKCYASIIN